MRLRCLETADIYRDGGSYEAFFSTDEELGEPSGYCVCLFRWGRPSSAGLSHKYLYAFRSEAPAGLRVPEGQPALLTGSEEEQMLLHVLTSFLRSPTLGAAATEYDVKRLQEMVVYIPKRKPYFADEPS